MRKGNYIYIGVAVVFLTLAIIQLFNAELLPISIYMYIAWASLELTLLELFKTTANYIKVLHFQRISLTQDEIDLCNRQIAVLGNFKALEKEVEWNRSFRETLTSRMDRFKEDKAVKVLERIISIITALQVILLFVQIAISYINRVPNGLLSNRVIGVLGLLSFAFLVFSYYLSRSTDEMIVEVKEKIDISNTLSNYYMDLFERVAVTKENNNANK